MSLHTLHSIKLNVTYYQPSFPITRHWIWQKLQAQRDWQKMQAQCDKQMKLNQSIIIAK